MPATLTPNSDLSAKASATADLPSSTELGPVSAHGHELVTSPDAFGYVRSSADYIDQPEELNRRLIEDGYLYIPGFFDRDIVQAARASVCERLAADGLLDPAYPAIEGVAHPDKETARRHQNAPVPDGIGIAQFFP